MISIILQLDLVFSQPIPKDHFLYQSRKMLYDVGKNWQSLSIFGTNRFKSQLQNEVVKHSAMMKTNGSLAINAKSNSHIIKGYGSIYFKDYYYGYIYPSFNIKSNGDQQYKGILNSYGNQNNHSGLGFENSWVILEIGKGNQNWGAGNDIQLALSENSEAFDYILLGSDYGRVRVRYIHGYLENIQKNINRYITARGFEWTNQRSLIIGFSETIIYSGENRQLDIGYFNPIASHLELELNDRLNVVGESNANAVWQMHLDYCLNTGIRFSANYLFDEFVLDKEIQKEKEHGRAFSLRMAVSPKLLSNNHFITVYGSFIYVGTPTFRHLLGSNNFIQNGKPLGWQGGSDCQNFSIGINYFNKRNLIFSLSTGFLQNGEESITGQAYEPYSDYLRGKFPSGIIEDVIYIETSFTYSLNDNITISSVLNLIPETKETYVETNFQLIQSLF